VVVVVLVTAALLDPDLVEAAGLLYPAVYPAYPVVYSVAGPVAYLVPVLVLAAVAVDREV